MAAGVLAFRGCVVTELRGVEIFSAGTQTDSGGFTSEFTVEDIDRIIQQFDAGSPEYVPVKLGHTSDAFTAAVAAHLDVPPETLHGENGEDGVISLGRVTRLRRAQDKLVADFDVPPEMADLVERQMLRDVSVEMVGEPGAWKLTGVAWLGAEMPAVKNLNGLAAAATLRQQSAGPVLAFKREAVVPAKGEEDGMEFSDLLKLFRGASDEEKEEARKALAYAEGDDDEDETEMEDGEDENAVTVAPIGGEVAAAIRAMAGCDINCTDDELLDALRSLVGLPSSAPADEVMPVMKARLQHKPVKFSDSSEYKSMRKEIDGLKRKDRLAHFKEETRGLLIQGKDEDLAAKLVDIEEKSGNEVATELLASWKRESEANRHFTQSAGTSHSGSAGDEHKFNETITAYMSEHKVDRQKAIARLALDPKTSEQFNEWRRETNSGVVEG